ncbi:MAG: putative DNA binding domain-containing protein [Chloroflexi bacterium]|nr:putative DNA binding domain-containing protein [Chloroflexota bacterium]
MHLHTPASSDYQEPGTTYLDILRRGEARGLQLMAFTDHNTAAGYRQMREEIEELELLERLKRLLPEERERLEEYRRLLEKIVVLPGFEFTATFGFHILGLFPPDKDVREIEHILLSLNIPAEQLDRGSSTVGATADVLTAYRLIDEAGGIAIAAHANSTNGVAMRGFGFGGQTKIAYTQDPHLLALEVTDLDLRGRRSTAAFFSGTKPEYPRQMHCIQGSDAHRLSTDPRSKKNLGVGDRGTDFLLDEVSFEALRALFESNDFARSRPHQATAAREEAYDFIQAAREDGRSIVQDFHASMTQRGGKLYAIIADVCAFANTNGGTLYVGVSADPRAEPAGVKSGEEAIRQLEKEINARISPLPIVTADKRTTRGKTVVRLLVARGDDAPYAVDDNKIYLREEAETGLAVRDEIVQLVLRGARQPMAPAPEALPLETAAPEKPPVAGGAPLPAAAGTPVTEPPRTGVEVVATEERNGARYHTVRDLRNGNVVKNVTRSSARRLWHYAISEHENTPDIAAQSITWAGEIGLWKKTKKGGVARYDFVQRTGDRLRVYYGVTADGIHNGWKQLVNPDEED